MITNLAVERQVFVERLDVVRQLVGGAHPAGVSPLPTSREIRGLAVLLTYAAYENLLTSVCRNLLETVVRLRVGNRRLRPGLKLVASFSRMQALQASTAAGIWRGGMDLVEVLTESRACSVKPGTFPNDGSNFRRGQVSTFCKVFGLGDPAPILREVWQQIDTVVAERNAIAHGQLAPGDVGRNYSVADITLMVDTWERRWGEFLDWIESTASTREFFRLRR